MKLGVLVMMGILGLAGSGVAERPFFAFDNAFDKSTPAEEQVALLKELGYDGICTRPAHATDELFAAIDKHGLEISAPYVVLPVREGDQVLPEGVAAHLRKLKGRQTIVWLGLSNAKGQDDQAVAIIRKVCSLAEENGLEVVLYPHINFCSDTVAKCERLRAKADCSNLGLSLTLCHFLAQNDHSELESTIKSIAAHLQLVQISGADQLPPGNPDWKRLIQPLGEGDFDVGRVMKTLEEIGYDGPMNLQCYSIPPPPRKHLAASMQAWKALNQEEK